MTPWGQMPRRVCPQGGLRTAHGPGRPSRRRTERSRGSARLGFGRWVRVGGPNRSSTRRHWTRACRGRSRWPRQALAGRSQGHDRVCAGAGRGVRSSPLLGARARPAVRGWQLPFARSPARGGHRYPSMTQSATDTWPWAVGQGRDQTPRRRPPGPSCPWPPRTLAADH